MCYECTQKTDEELLSCQWQESTPCIRDLCLSQDYQVMPALLMLADWLIARYPGTHKADEELLRSGSVQGRLRSAVLVRAGERRLARRFKEEVLIILAREEGDRCHSAPSMTHPPVLACPGTGTKLAGSGALSASSVLLLGRLWINMQMCRHG